MVIILESELEMLGYHCTKRELNGDFQGDISGEYTARFLRSFIDIIKSNHLYNEFKNLLKEENDFYEEEDQNEKIIDIDHLIDELPIYEYEQEAYDVIAAIFDNLSLNIIFTNDSPLKQYGEFCYKVRVLNRNYVRAEDGGEILANVYIIWNKTNKFILS